MAARILQAVGGSGFNDPPREAQVVFRAVMNALAHPTKRQPLEARLAPPAPLTPELAAMALALVDGDAPVWLDAPLAANPAIAAFIRFHTGAPIVGDAAQAAFALVADPANLPPFEAFALGSEEFPDRSTTIVLSMQGFHGDESLTFEGPGLREPSSFAPAPMPANLRRSLEANRLLFPRGVDLVFVAPGEVAALPRSSRLVGGH